MAELPRLSRSAVRDEQNLLELPEKAVQFGTGAFLRGFIEYFIDAANRAGIFGGRIVAIGSTGSGRDRLLNQQDGLYTLAVRGLDDGVLKRENRVITSLSRALSAAESWKAVLECSRNPALELVFSNTTEAGFRIDPSDAPGPAAPSSFPAKLTRFLYERAVTFDYSPDYGLTILPCELLENNGDRLRELVLELAELWRLDSRFIDWLDNSVPFCNTLVDRIVPGEPALDERQEYWHELGYRDELLTVAEPYRLFAIEATARTANRLAFAAADPHVILTADVTPYRERKLRLLNGTHSIMVPLALLAGCTTVAEAVADPAIGAFVRHLLAAELAPSVRADGVELFASQVLERFANPYIQHALLDITLQQTAKLRVRIVPPIVAYAASTGRPPAGIAIGFAAYLWYMHVAPGAQRADDHAEHIRAIWQTSDNDPQAVATRVCSDATLWGIDLARVPGFVDQVTAALTSMMRNGIRTALDQHLAVHTGAVT